MIFFVNVSYLGLVVHCSVCLNLTFDFGLVNPQVPAFLIKLLFSYEGTMLTIAASLQPGLELAV